VRRRSPPEVALSQAKLIARALAVTLPLRSASPALSTYGLSEDEMNKVEAIEQYRAGHFTANASIRC